MNTSGLGVPIFRYYRWLKGLIIALLFLNIQLFAAPFSGAGSGTVGDPYQIVTPAHLNEVRNSMTSHYKLMNDIDLTAYLASGGDGYTAWGTSGWMPLGHSGTGTTLSAVFSGTFDGNFKTISGLFINRPTLGFVGLFSQITSGTIKNLKIDISGDISGTQNVGVLSGDSVGTINNCHSSSTAGAVKASSEMSGGLIGRNSAPGTVNNSSSQVDIISTNSGVGGLVGRNNAIITKSFATGNVTGTNALGGLAGNNYGTTVEISDSYSTGNVTSSTNQYYVAGLVGEAKKPISRSYSVGAVTTGYTNASFKGAFSGESTSVITDSFFNSDTSIITTNPNMTGLTSSTTANMQNQASSIYTGWDFTNVWEWKAGSGVYPTLIPVEGWVIPDITPPTIATVSVNTLGTIITITFDEDLNTSKVPDLSKIIINGTSVSGWNYVYSGNRDINLTATSGTILNGQTITLSILVDSNISDGSDNNFTTVTNHAVTNNSTIVLSTDTHLIYKHGSSWSINNNGGYIAINGNLTTIPVSAVDGNISKPTGGATIQIFDSFNVEKTSGNLALGDYVKVTSGDGTATRIYKLFGIKPQISAGENHTLILDADGKVYSFGSNEYGQLGRTTTETIDSMPTQIDIAGENNITAIVATKNQSFLLDKDGKVYSFGYSEYGQLGHGDTQNKLVPTQIAGISNIVSISAGTFHTLLLGKDGKVYSFGNGGYGKLGHGNETSFNVPTQIMVAGENNITAITAGASHSLLLGKDGKVYSFGYSGSGELGHGNEDTQLSPKQITAVGENNITAMSASGSNSLLLGKDGKVYSFGNSGDGRLGLGDSVVSNTNIPTQIVVAGDNNITAIAQGESHTLILDKNGKVYGFGNNFEGRLGLGSLDTTSKSLPTQITAIADKNITAITIGAYHSLLLDVDGKIYSFGNSNSGQLGLCDLEVKFVPTEIVIGGCPIVADTIPPVVTDNGTTNITISSATISGTSDENGTMYYVITTSTLYPTASQIRSGKDHLGDTAIVSGNATVTADTEKTFEITGLDAGVSYRYYLLAVDESDNNSTITRGAFVMNVARTVTFDTNGGNSIASQTILYNTTATLPSAPTKTGYTFVGWYSESGLVTSFDFDTHIIVNTTLYAKWSLTSGGSTPTPTPINGTCGASNGITTLIAPSTNLCSIGTITSVTSNSTTHSWSCNGIDGGTADSCSANKPIANINTGGGSTAVSGLGGTTSTTNINNNQVLTSNTTNTGGVPIVIEAELPTDTSSIVKTKHKIAIGGKETVAISKLEATVDIKSDKSVETKADINTTQISVIAKPDGTAEHTVTLQSGKISKATSDIVGAKTEIKISGEVETMAGDVNATESGYTIKAVAITKADGTTLTRFIKVNNADETDVTVLGNTVKSTTPFEAGNNVQIEEISGTLYMKIEAPLSDVNLEIE